VKNSVFERMDCYKCAVEAGKGMLEAFFGDLWRACNVDKYNTIQD
jgi:hypothetical protein